ncbi:MAG: ankyrin repeat domain-containing protein [archaeon]|nr:ankyrin repeat domain-containing protein [archaeon]
MNELLALLEKDGLTDGHVQGRAAGWVERQVQGSYAAHLAAEAGAVESLRVLLGAGCRADLRDAQGSTPLMWACGEGQERAAGLLLAEGADAWARDGSGDTALHYAALNGHSGAAGLLLGRAGERAAEYASASNQAGDGALHLAVVNGHVACARLLLERGADGDAANGQGRTARALAEGREGETALRSCFSAEARPLLGLLEEERRERRALEERVEEAGEREKRLRLAEAEAEVRLRLAQEDAAERQQELEAARKLNAQMRGCADELEKRLDALVQQMDLLKQHNRELQDRLSSTALANEHLQQQLDAALKHRDVLSSAPLDLSLSSAISTATAAPSPVLPSLPASVVSSTAPIPAAPMMARLAELQQVLLQCTTQISQVQHEYFRGSSH